MRKRVVAWLAVFAMMLGALPINSVYADVQTQGEQRYSGSFEEYVNTCAVRSVAGYEQEDFEVSLPDQENIEEKDDNSFTATGDFYLRVKVPEGYNKGYLALYNGGGDDAQKVDCTVSPVGSVADTFDLMIEADTLSRNFRLKVRDEQYFRAELGMMTDADKYRIEPPRISYTDEDGELQTEPYYIVSQGAVYPFEVVAIIEEGDDVSKALDDLELYIDGEKQENSGFTQIEVGEPMDGEVAVFYSYTVTGIDKDCVISLADAKGNVSLHMCGLPNTWKLYTDANGEPLEADCEDEEYGTADYSWSTPYNKSCDFFVEPQGDPYRFGFAYEGNLCLKGTDAAGGKKKFTLTAKKGWNLSFGKLHTITVQGASVIPCDGDWNYDPAAEPCTEFDVLEDSPVYFNVVGDFKYFRYQIVGMPGEEEEYFCYNNKHMYFYLTDDSMEDITIRIMPKYAVYMEGQSVYGNEDVIAVDDDDTGKTLYLYDISEEGEAEVSVTTRYQSDLTNLKAVLIDSAGHETQLEDPKIELGEFDESIITYSLTGLNCKKDYQLKISGIERKNYFEAQYRDIPFEAFELLDENGQNILNYGWSDIFSAHITEGKEYSLKVKAAEGFSPDELRAVYERSEDGEYGEELTAEKEGGACVYRIKDISGVTLLKKDQFLIESSGGGFRLCNYRTDEDLERIVEPAEGEKSALAFYLLPYEGRDISGAQVEITDFAGNKITPKTEKNMPVGNLGERGTVYTIPLDRDIRISVKGVGQKNYDVYLPTSCGNLYTYYESDEDEGWTAAAGTAVGTDKKYRLDYDTFAKFCIKMPKGALPMYVSKVITDDDGNVSEKISLEGDKVEEGNSGYDENYDTYEYRFWIEGMTRIYAEPGRQIKVYDSKAADRKELERTEGGTWIYRMDLEDGSKDEAVLYLETIRELQQKSAFDVSVELWYDYVVPEKSADSFLFYKAADNTWKPISAKDHAGRSYYVYTIPADCTELYFDVTKIEKGTFYFTIDEDSFTEKGIACKVSEKYEKNKDGMYVSRNGGAEITLIADSEEDLDRWMLSAYADLISDNYYAYEGGKTAGDYRIALEEGTVTEIGLREKAWHQVDYGDAEGIEDIWSPAYEPETMIPAGTEMEIQVMVAPGYDPRSVVLVQKYGEDQTHEYDVTDYGYTLRDCSCVVTLEPGENVFTVKQTPKKAVYTIDCAASSAYEIKPEAGSSLTAGYGDSFSFKVVSKNGYDLSKAIVNANGKKMVPDENGVYIIRKIDTNYTITVTGFYKNTVTVTFVDHDGKVLKKQEVEAGKNAAPPANPARAGYTFVNWIGKYTAVTSDSVVRAEYKVKNVTAIRISGKTGKLGVNKTLNLTAAVTPSDVLNKDVNWTSSNPKWATVSSKGVVKALAAGAGKKVTITAIAKDGSGVKATYAITIEKNLITKLKLSAKAKKLKVGKKLAITVKYTPKDNINKKLKWTSSNTKYATVSAKGVVTAKKKGKGKTVTITAQALDGSKKKATIKIKIVK